MKNVLGVLFFSFLFLIFSSFFHVYAVGPSTIINGGVSENEVEYGGNQRKIVFSPASNKWYAVRENDTASTPDSLGDIQYMTSVDGITWVSPITISDTATCPQQASNPSLTISGSLIYIVWNERNCANGTDDQIIYRTIDTANSDLLSSPCATNDLGTINGRDQNSIAVYNGRVYVINDNDPDFLSTTTATCAFSNVLSGYGVTSSDRPVLVNDGALLHVVFQDGNLSQSTFNGSSWVIANKTIASNTDTVFSATTDGAGNTWVLSVAGNTGTGFYKLDTNNSGGLPLTDVDSTAGTDPNNAIACVTGDDCKIVYYDEGATPGKLVFVDCENEDCSQNIQTIINSDVGSGSIADIYCVSSFDCKFAYNDRTSSDSGTDTIFVDCDNSSCSVNTQTILDSNVGTSQAPMGISCISSDDCRVAFSDRSNSSLYYVDCGNVTCSLTDAFNQIDSSGSGDVAISCLAFDDCKIFYMDKVGSTFTPVFVDCQDAACSGIAGECYSGSRICTTVDSNAGTITATVSLSCPSVDNCKPMYNDLSDGDLVFVDCNDASCSTFTLTDVDLDAFANGHAKSEIFCTTGDNCKMTYQDRTEADQQFVDCDNETCSQFTISDIDTDISSGSGNTSGISCPASDNCKISYIDDTDDDLSFADCPNEACAVGIPPALDFPWIDQTNVTSVSLTYDSFNDDLIANIIKGASEQAYWKSTDASNIVWGIESSYGFTPGDLGHISTVEVSAGVSSESAKIGVTLRQGTNLEFASF